MKEVLNEFYSGTSAGHLRVTKSLERLKQRLYWVGCHQAVADWIANCTQRTADKCSVRRGRVQLHQYSSGAHLERTAIANDRMEASYDRASNREGFHKGQLVLFYNRTRQKGLSPKLQN